VSDESTPITWGSAKLALSAALALGTLVGVGGGKLYEMSEKVRQDSESGEKLRRDFDKMKEVDARQTTELEVLKTKIQRMCKDGCNDHKQ